MSFVSIGELAKQKFKQGLPVVRDPEVSSDPEREATKIYSSVGFSDCAELLCGHVAAQSLHQLYQHNGRMVVAATSKEAYDIAQFRQSEMVSALQQLGLGVQKITIL